MFGETDIDVNKEDLLEGQDRYIDEVDAGLEEEAKDEEGYFSVKTGETFNKGRYQIVSAVGRGVFSTVLCAKDLQTDMDVAIKVIRSNDVMYRAGQKEIALLRQIAENDPEDKKHIVRMLDHFMHKGHLCIVFERYDLNLREVMKKFGKNTGINIAAVRSYGKQLLIALQHLVKLDIVHADIKPDNVLVTKARNVVKMCDLGSASTTAELAITPYLVSRFYRAPEIMLGHEYDSQIDLWSVACCLFEMYTGRILFAGRNNNQMLKHIQDLCGAFSNKMLRKSMFRELHFRDDFVFISKEKDPVSKKGILRHINYQEMTANSTKEVSSAAGRKDLLKMICPNLGQLDDEELKRVTLFRDLMEKMLVLDPNKRIGVKGALLHPFFTSK